MAEYARPEQSTRFVTKDSGARQEYASGMVRDVQTNKPRFDLLLADGLGYEDQPLTRVAALLQRGAEKYDARNWEKANTEEELERFKASALRHMFQWASGALDEDHMAAVVFNLFAYEVTSHRLAKESA